MLLSIFQPFINKINKMYNQRESIGTKARQNNFFKTSLGNNKARYNSQVAVQRRKYLISSTKNSEDVPDWMSRTQSYHFRDHNRNRSLFTNAASPFKHVEQTYVYARLPKPANPESQFDRLPKHRIRNKWEMKSQTFEFDWPKSQKEIHQSKKKCFSQMTTYQTAAPPRPSSRQNEIMRINLPKYAYKESPLHVQKETPIKIGHPYMLNSTYIK